MKKLLTTITIILIVLFLFYSKLNAKQEYKYKENIHSVKFKNLNSKNINSLFEDINETVIEIQIQTPFFTKNYHFHTGITNNIERILLEKLTQDLKELGKQELATTYQVNGIKVTKMKIICTYEELEIIKSRVKTE